MTHKAGGKFAKPWFPILPFNQHAASNYERRAAQMFCQAERLKFEPAPLTCMLHRQLK
jgi:hypothetical protein